MCLRNIIENGETLSEDNDPQRIVIAYRVSCNRISRNYIMTRQTTKIISCFKILQANVELESITMITMKYWDYKNYSIS